MDKTRILIVEDVAMWRDALQAYIQSKDHLEVAGVAISVDEAKKLTQALSPDLVIMDMTFERLSGPMLAQDLLGITPQLRIVMLTMCTDELCVNGLLDIGIMGIVLKSSEGDELLMAVQKVMDQQVYIDSHLTSIIHKPAKLMSSISSVMDCLANDERELCRLLALGYTTTEASTMLHISVQKVMLQENNVMQKIGAQNRADLVCFALRAGLI